MDHKNTIKNAENTINTINTMKHLVPEFSSDELGLGLGLVEQSRVDRNGPAELAPQVYPMSALLDQVT